MDTSYLGKELKDEDFVLGGKPRNFTLQDAQEFAKTVSKIVAVNNKGNENGYSILDYTRILSTENEAKIIESVLYSILKAVSEGHNYHTAVVTGQYIIEQSIDNVNSFRTIYGPIFDFLTGEAEKEAYLISRITLTEKLRGLK